MEKNFVDRKTPLDILLLYYQLYSLEKRGGFFCRKNTKLGPSEKTEGFAKT